MRNSNDCTALVKEETGQKMVICLMLSGVALQSYPYRSLLSCVRVRLCRFTCSTCTSQVAAIVAATSIGFFSPIAHRSVTRPCPGFRVIVDLVRIPV